ncbi:hypothetical protein HYPSUDRAFT_47820 [Hypholoma sublateritium FD-334 SS-4]|uniref:Uncharacterized protein n=1 Tax=Hypholoma sublateritium (strain FD-334 SS-4) TaxID=945553 RepID=A0A0D2NH38_HYPSF|nr:hypothetical protein HYPSUDRAFT_47820 [Hypholoma sublateritium FD-334 SS-4]
MRCAFKRGFDKFRMKRKRRARTHSRAFNEKRLTGAAHVALDLAAAHTYARVHFHSSAERMYFQPSEAPCSRHRMMKLMME